MREVYLKILLVLLSFHLISAKEELLKLDNQLYRLVRAEGDDVQATESPPPDESKNSTTAASCNLGNNCCAMYTWPGNNGYIDDVETAPRKCSDLPSIKNDKLNKVACFGPIVYSNSTANNRPDPVEVTKTCERDSLACFCTGEVCIKLTYRQNDKEQKLVNETRFCGTITNVATSAPVKSGCYKEIISGTSYIREVCACKTSSTSGGYCNASTGSSIKVLIQLNLTLLILALLHTFIPN